MKNSSTKEKLQKSSAFPLKNISAGSNVVVEDPVESAGLFVTTEDVRKFRLEYLNKKLKAVENANEESESWDAMVKAEERPQLSKEIGTEDSYHPYPVYEGIDFSPEFDMGRSRIGMTTLPQAIVNNINRIIRKLPRETLKEDVERVTEYVRSLHPKELKTFEDPLPSGKNIDKLKKAPRISAQENIARSVMDYAERESLAYLTVQSAFAYAPARRVLHEIFKRLPNFVPKSVLDFGTGPGTCLWAAYDVWGVSIQNAVGIDISAGMLDIAEEMLKDDNGNAFMNVQFRRYQSLQRQQTQHDLVICSFTLSEMPGDEARQQAVLNLWDQTKDILVLIDRGTPEGFRQILQMRDMILALNKKENIKGIVKRRDASDLFGVGKVYEHEGIVRKTNRESVLLDDDIDSNMYEILETEEAAPIENMDADKEVVKVKVPGRVGRSGRRDVEDVKVVDKTNEEVAHVLAPCPHDDACPMQNSWCHFSQRQQLTENQMSLLKYRSNFQDQKFSYVVLRRGPRPAASAIPTSNAKSSDVLSKESLFWSRIVGAPHKRPRNVRLDICSKDGSLLRVVAPKSQGKQVYYDARHAQWGDLWPHTIQGKPIVHQDFSKEGRRRAANLPKPAAVSGKLEEQEAPATS